MSEKEQQAVLDYQSSAAASVAADQPDPNDPYSIYASDAVDPPRALGGMLRQVGPGLILAGAIVGTGELIATTQVGAQVGFTLLWLVALSCVIKVFVQVELGRYTISSGHTTMRSFRELPGPGLLVGGIWVVMMLATQLQLGAMVGGVGQAFHMAMPSVSPHAAWAVGKVNAGWGTYLAGRPEIFWAFFVTIGTVATLARGSYRVIETGTTAMVVAFTIVTVICVLLLPRSGHPIDWAAVGGGLTFSLPSSPDAMKAALAMIGITGVGAAELVAYPYWCIEKGYARKAGLRTSGDPAWPDRARGWMRVMRLDAWVSCALYTVSTLAFFFLGAAVLHGLDAKSLPQNVSDMLVTLSKMYQPVMGPSAALWFIVIGVFAVLYSTLFASTGANSRALTDYLRVNRWVAFTPQRDRMWWVRLFCVAFPILDFFLFVWIGNPLAMVTIGGIAQAMTLPLLAAAAVYLRYRRTDRRITPGKVWDAFLWVSLAGMTLAAGVGLWTTVAKAMK
jgi:Mn2+/Fe2+ NRAMP family transporter